jgi:hypothetical protein
MNVTATETKSRLGQVLEQAQTRPVFIEKSGRRHSVELSVEHCEALLQDRQRAAAPDAGKRFYAQHKAWVDQQNRHVDKHGVFGEESWPW